MTHTAAHTPAHTAQVLPFPRPVTQPAATVRVVVPCYNEAERLNVDAFIAFLDQRPGIDFVFVNDGSKDATLDVLAAIQMAHPARVEVLSLRQNSGKAEAVRQGLLHATQSSAAFVGYWDADLATPLDAIEDFARIGARFADVEVIFGARRMMLGHRVERTLMRRTVSRVCATLARMAVRLPIGDTQCGAKLLRNTDTLVEALAEPFSAGWLFDVELFTRIAAGIGAARTGFYEYPLPEWTEIAGSKVSGRAILRSGVSMLRLIAESRLGLPRAAVSRAVPMVDVIAAPVAAPLSRAA